LFLPLGFPLPLLLLLLPAEEFELIHFHRDTGTSKNYAFHLQPQALFLCGMAGKQNFSTRPDNAMPGQAIGDMERPSNLPRGTGISCCMGNGAVTGHFSLGDLTDRASKRIKHCRLL